jgi:hypothetical protein
LERELDGLFDEVFFLLVDVGLESVDGVEQLVLRHELAVLFLGDEDELIVELDLLGLTPLPRFGDVRLGETHSLVLLDDVIELGLVGVETSFQNKIVE